MSSPCARPSTTPASRPSRSTSAWSPRSWSRCPTRVRPRRSCASSRPSTTTMTCRPSTPTPTSPTRSWPPSKADPDPPPAQGPRLIYEQMFVLGIDPGLSRCGYGLVDRAEGTAALRAHAAGVIETDPAAPLHERLVILHTEVRALVQELGAG